MERTRTGFADGKGKGIETAGRREQKKGITGRFSRKKESP